MNDSDQELREVPVDSGESGERLQESIVGDGASVATAVFAGIAAGHQIWHRMSDARGVRAQLQEKNARLRKTLELERRARIAATHGLEALDDYDSGLGYGEFSNPVNFDVEDDDYYYG